MPTTASSTPITTPSNAPVPSGSFWIFNALMIIGFGTTIAALIYIGRKLQILNDLQITVNRIKSNMQVITNFLTRNHEKFNAEELQAFSPLRLTDIGTALITNTGFAAAFNSHKKDFFDFLDSEEPKQKYDVETASIKSIYALYDKPYMAFLKTFFYNNSGRNLENTAPTLGIYVRDAFLTDHPEIIA